MMKSSTVIVNVEPEIALKLATFASELSGDKGKAFLAECVDCANKGDSAAIVDKLLSQSSVVFGTDNASDIEGYFQGILFVVQYYVQQPQWEAVVGRIVTSITASPTAATNEHRLAALVALHNLSEDARCRYLLIQAAFDFALATEQSAQVARFHTHVDGWVAQWTAASAAVVSTAELRRLFQAVARVIAAAAAPAASAASSSGSPAVPASIGLQFLTRSLATFQAAGDKGGDLQALAQDAVVQALAMCGPGSAAAHTAAFQCRNELFYSLSAVRSQLTGPAAQLMDLLRVVCTGDLAAFLASFAVAGSPGAALLKTHGLSAEKLEHTLRLLTICSLVEAERTAAAATPTDAPTPAASGSTSSMRDGATVVIEFATIARHLQLAASVLADADAAAMEVEFWLVEAVASRLLDASIDQVSQTVTVNRFAHMVAAGAGTGSSLAALGAQLTAIRSSVAAGASAVAAAQQ